MNSLEQTTLLWRKSSYSNGTGGECVEVTTAHNHILIRDSKNPDGPALVFRKATLRNLTDHLCS